MMGMPCPSVIICYQWLESVWWYKGGFN
jgi:hypothetical protein